MDRTPDALQQLLRLVPEHESPELRPQCAGLARRVRQLGLRSVGLLPADDDVAVPSVLVHLGHALAEGSLGPVGIVDAQGTWDGLSAWTSESGDDAGQIAIRSQLTDRLVFLAPRVTVSASALRQLQLLLTREAPSLERMLVDLTGFSGLGEQLAACELVDGILLVARRGRTTIRTVRRRLHELETANCLGVLLTGA